MVAANHNGELNKAQINGQRFLFDGGLSATPLPRRQRKPKTIDADVVASAVASQVADCFQAVIEELRVLQIQVAELKKAAAEKSESETATKELYTTQEAARILGKRPYTVREWCRLQRVNAVKTKFGRGQDDEWRIPHDELVRIQNEGLLPIPKHY